MIIPKVSIVVLNWSHPDAKRPNVIRELLNTIPQTVGTNYELVVVDLASPDTTTVPLLIKYKEVGTITTLVPLNYNAFFCEGNNIGYRHTNPESEYILLLNPDIAILRPEWLLKLVQWMEGDLPIPCSPQCDIVSAGWSADPNVQPSIARPEGSCCLIRRSAWRDSDPAFVQANGLEEALAISIRNGAKCGVLTCCEDRYFTHFRGATESWRNAEEISGKCTRQPDFSAWFDGLVITPLDFTLTEETKYRICNTPDWQWKDDEDYITCREW